MERAKKLSGYYEVIVQGQCWFKLGDRPPSDDLEILELLILVGAHFSDFYCHVLANGYTPDEINKALSTFVRKIRMDRPE